MSVQGKPITQTQWARVLTALKKGNTRRAACAVGDLTEETFYRRLREDLSFSESVTRAENEAEAYYAGVIKQAAADDWRAAESWLKRRRREDWGDAIDVRKLTDEQVIRLLESEAGGGSGAEGAPPVAVGNGKH